MSGSWTPGPWKQVTYGHGGSRIFVGGDEHGRGRKLVAYIYLPAYARLIAATPEMAELLKRVVAARSSGGVVLGPRICHEIEALLFRIRGGVEVKS